MTTKPRKLTLKQKKFIKITAETLNPTEGARQAYNLGGKDGKKTKERQTTLATTIANDNMTKPDIQQGLREVLSKDIDVNKRSMLLNRNASQKNNLSASNQALDMLIKISGDYSPEKKLNINVNADNIDKRIKELQDELNL